MEGKISVITPAKKYQNKTHKNPQKTPTNPHLPNTNKQTNKNIRPQK